MLKTVGDTAKVTIVISEQWEVTYALSIDTKILDDLNLL